MASDLRPILDALKPLADAYDAEIATKRKAKADRERKPDAEKAATRAARNKRHRAKQDEERRSMIAVLDMETDPFDNVEQERIAPFAACIASDHFDPIEIWDEDQDRFIEKVISAIESLPGKFTIYAHNGGKFDYLFFVHRLRGAVSFKGRGIMAAKVGNHEIRDSFHILPEKLAAYRKDDFDYGKMRKGVRTKHKQEITTYLRNDCLYLLDFVKAFIAENGLKLSIGQASLAAVQEAGVKVENISESMDAYLRGFYFGGRVECIQGLGEFNAPPDEPLRLYDVNSMYPDAMARQKHPVGKDYILRRGKPGPHTVFIDLSCDNYGAFVCRDDEGGTTAAVKQGRFRTTIFEYNVALKYNLVENVQIHYCVDSLNRKDFSAFVLPKYQKRQEYKKLMKDLIKTHGPLSAEYLDAKIRDILLKFYLNNAYGKYAQNPRNYRETFITDHGKRPHQPVKMSAEWLEKSKQEWGGLPVYQNEDQNYAVWEKPVSKLRFKNVGTAASITGAARAVLLEAICNADNPIYCDTDSIICSGLRNTRLDPSELGAWDLEDLFTSVRVVGKKLYACERAPSSPQLGKGPHKVASKGVAAPSWSEYGELLVGKTLEIVAKGPTMTKRGTQTYVTRNVRATAKPANRPMIERLSRCPAPGFRSTSTAFPPPSWAASEHA